MPESTTAAVPDHPADQVGEFVLRDGSSIRLRPVRDDDIAHLHHFFETVSSRSLSYRFFGVTNIDWATDWATHIDSRGGYTIVAEAGDGQEIVAHGGYIRNGSQSAEIAFLVTDREQGLGVATLMISQLARVAHADGIERFNAEVLPNNHRMLAVFRDCGFPCNLRWLPGSVQVELETERAAPTEVPESARHV